MLEELRLARDRLIHTPVNSSRPSGSMPAWHRGAGGGSAHFGSAEDGPADDEPFGQATGVEAACKDKPVDAQDAAPQHGGSPESAGARTSAVRKPR